MTKKDRGTFAGRAMRFHRKLHLPAKLPPGVAVMNPFREGKALKLSDAFLKKFYGDRRERVLVLGINPSRFGAGLTGVAFTDPLALQEFCGIPNDLPKKRELSSTFVYQAIEAYGGPKEFFGDFFLTATYPLGFLKGGVNYNFYDEQELQRLATPLIVEAMQAQIGFGCSRKIAVVLGTGKLKAFWDKLNAEHRFFKRIVYLEHPRYIMQYKRSELRHYLTKYKATLKKALAEARPNTR